MKIAIVVQGRFHAFDLARVLISRGHEVVVLTNYPASAMPRFGLPRTCARTFVLHGVLERALRRLGRMVPPALTEPWLHRLFGRWAASTLAGLHADVVHCWSGVSEELLTSLRGTPTATLLMRGSTHIAVQAELLREEARRSGTRTEQATAWMVARECREYALADQIVVLSSFARDGFVSQGIPPERVSVLPLGVDTTAFEASPEVREARVARILGGGPLRLLYVGALSFQKGLLDLMDAAKRLEDVAVEFRLVGPRMAETERLVSSAGPNVHVLGKRPQADLPPVYWDADVFVFPTIQDGFGMVLTQAKAAGLPIVTTPNSAGPDLLIDGEDGWIVPIRDPDALAARLRWCAANRGALADMTRDIGVRYRPKDWLEIAAHFEVIAEDVRRVKAVRPAAPAVGSNRLRAQLHGR